MKQNKKYKFLQILHDYPTSATEILNKAALENKAPERSSTVLPSSTKNRSDDDFSFFKRNREARRSDAMFMPQKTSISTLLNDSEKAQKYNHKSSFHNLGESRGPFEKADNHKINLFGDEFKKLVEKNEKERKRSDSTDICRAATCRKTELYHNTSPVLMRSKSTEILISKHPKESYELSPNYMMDLKPSLDDELLQNRNNRDTVIQVHHPESVNNIPYKNEENGDKSHHKITPLDLNLKSSPVKMTESDTCKHIKPKIANEENEPQLTVRKNEEKEEDFTRDSELESRYISFGGSKPTTKPPFNSKVSKNLSDIEALLEYEGDDIDQLAMVNSKDALRIMDNIEEMIDGRINSLLDNDHNMEGMGENLFGLQCY